MYDVIIIGAGLGGLSAGLELALKSKKVLILEKNSLPGGSVTTFKKGRFEFDVGLSDFYDLGTDNKKGKIKNILNKYGVSLEANVIPYSSKVIFSDTKEEFEMKGDVDEFFVELEKLKNGSGESLKQFLRVIKEIHDAFEELQKGNEDLEDYPNFLKYLDKNVLDALSDLNMPKETIHRLGFLWVYLGSPLDKLSFIDFAEFMYKVIFKKVNVLRKKNVDFVLNMTKRFRELGGKIFYHACVTKIEDDGLFKLVKTEDGKEYKAKNVICDLAKRYVYQNLIDNTDKDVNRLENARTVAPSAFILYLGLNTDYKTIGFKYYHYYHFGTMNSVQNVKSMSEFYHPTWDVTIPNVVNEFASPKNTSILILKTTYLKDPFLKVTKDNYLSTKENIAKNLIKQFEEATHLDIQEYIEEMSIVSPFEINDLTHSPNGSIMGMARKSYDNAIHRVISYQDEKIPNMYFVGGSSIFGGGADNAIYSGQFMAKQLLESEEKEDGK